jgi:RNA polymerase sigma factor (sigma-70 family)
MPVDSRELDRLLSASPPEHEHAWQAFVAAYSRLLLHVARSFWRDHDEIMDAYAFILQELRAQDSARLRAFGRDGRSKFSTWLVVVARRLCMDFRRQRYGRAREVQSESARLDHLFRRRLCTLNGEDVELAELAASLVSPDDELSGLEVRQALASAFAALPTSDRLLLKLRFVDDCSAQQIARVLHLPSPFHVYRRLEAVTNLLRRVLIARGVESAAP